MGISLETQVITHKCEVLTFGKYSYSNLNISDNLLYILDSYKDLITQITTTSNLKITFNLYVLKHS